jgi:hypothetical protein
MRCESRLHAPRFCRRRQCTQTYYREKQKCNVPSKAEAPASEVYRIKDEPAAACLRTVTGTRQERGRRALAPLQLYALRDRHAPFGHAMGEKAGLPTYRALRCTPRDCAAPLQPR